MKKILEDVTITRTDGRAFKAARAGLHETMIMWETKGIFYHVPLANIALISSKRQRDYRE